MNVLKQCSLWALLCCLPATASQSETEKLLVMCRENGACECRKVATFLVQERPSIRLLSASTAGLAEFSGYSKSREVRLDSIPGLYRDAKSGFFYALDVSDKPGEIAIPSKLDKHEDAKPAELWSSTSLEYSDSPHAKSGTPVASSAFAVLLISPNAVESAVRFIRHLLDSADGDSRRVALIQAALRFCGNSPVMQQWRESLLIDMRDSMQRYAEQSGDPIQLMAQPENAMRARDTYLRISERDVKNQDLLDRVAATNDLLARRLAIAAALWRAQFWDEYLLKLGQLGIGRWSMPDLVRNTREALSRSASAHLELSRQAESKGQLDRAFDEAETAAAHDGCDASVNGQFYRMRISLVERNRIPIAEDYAGPHKTELDQIVRELDQMDAAKERWTLDRIRFGETLDPHFLPLQWKKAEFLNSLGKYDEALAVIRKVERETPLDAQAMEECLRLEGKFMANRGDILQKAEEQTRKNFEAQHFQASLESAASGLRADPGNPVLLYYSALAASFVRGYTEAVLLAKTYLENANLLCAAEGEPQNILELYRTLVNRAPDPLATQGIPHWISGRRYLPGEVFYDPISLGFLQPVARVIGVSKGAPDTVFRREEQSYLVKSISTSFTPNANSTKRSDESILFEAEPKYERKTLSMLEIGPRASSTGERPTYPLTYWNSPTVDPGLILRFTGRQVARGWAGNPFFHPFIWRGFYLFDLTYDELGRVVKATPVVEEAGARIDPFSEPLQFTWQGSSLRLISIRGVRSGYQRELDYDTNGRLKAEKINYPKGHGSIEYTYAGSGPTLKEARCNDDVYEKNRTRVIFDLELSLR